MKIMTALAILCNMCVCSEDEHKLIHQYCLNLNGRKSDSVSHHIRVLIIIIIIIIIRFEDTEALDAAQED